MKFVIAFVGLFAVASAGLAPIIATYPAAATTLVRSPSDDSAIVQSERIGGSFAYSTVEGHAYKAYTPIIQNLVTSVYSPLALNPAVYTAAAAPVATTTRLLLPQQTLLTSAPGLTYLAAAPGLPLNIVQNVAPVDAAAAAPVESRADADEPKPEEKKDNSDAVVVESA